MAGRVDSRAMLRASMDTNIQTYLKTNIYGGQPIVKDIDELYAQYKTPTADTAVNGTHF